MPLLDLYTMHILVIGAVFAALALFCWQYCECAKSQRSEKNLQEKNQDLGCFAYAAAHDLKAPLRAILQLSERLERSLSQAMTDAQKEDMALLQSRARRLDKLIDDLLAYWLAGRDTPLPHNDRISADTLVQDITRLLSPPESFIIEAAAPLSGIIVMRHPLQQVLYNLIGNAIKHHQGPGGKILIDIKRTGDMLDIHVSDDGPGVPPPYREKIFEMFETLKSRDEVEGSGMGLALARRIVTRQGGEIGVADSPLGGALFHFTWPADD